MDIYARPFVPQSYIQTNLSERVVIPSAPPPNIAYVKYTSTFAGSAFLQSNDYLSQSLVQDGDDTTDVNGFDEELELPSYKSHFNRALAIEYRALQQECAENALYDQSLQLFDASQSLYQLMVPGLRETTRRIDVGDVVQIRRLSFVDPSFHNEYNLAHHPDPQFNATVWRIDRQSEMLYLRIDFLDRLYHPYARYNVTFTAQANRLQDMRTAVADIDHQLSTTASNGWIRSMIFPAKDDGMVQTSLNNLHNAKWFFDKALNYEQAKAIQTVLENHYGRIPYLISGPPGTGKTKTIVEMTLQILRSDDQARVLLCAPSDPAADTLVSRLKNNLTPQHLLRLNAASRSFPEVPDSILPYCYIDGSIFSLPPFTALMKTKVVVVTCRDAEILIQARLSNRDLHSLESRLHVAIHADRVISPDLHWNVLIVDEAAQAMEPEALIPMQVVCPPKDFETSGQRVPIVVMAGDQHQLGPRTASREPAIQCSLFERLLNRPLYHDHPLARSKLTNGIMRPLTASMLPILRPAFTNLIQNYRSHPGILAVPSSQFYHDTLEPAATDTSTLLHWSGFRQNPIPVLFLPNASPDIEERLDGGGWYNPGEATTALATAQSLLLSDPSLPASEVCLMSPFRAQVRYLRHLARSRGLPGLNIGPLEAFQGLEARAVILCTTRTRERFLDRDIAAGLGVVHEPRRFNVALTRARQALVVIGNPALLAQDEHWANFLAFCRRNDCVGGEGHGRMIGEEEAKWEAVHGEKIKVSRLEKQLWQRNSVDMGTTSFGRARLNGEALAWQSGLEAEQAVREEDEVWQNGEAEREEDEVWENGEAEVG